MAGMRLTTDRLTLRHFTEQDMAALHLLLQDEAVNTFLPWFPMKNIEQTRAFYRARMAGPTSRPRTTETTPAAGA